MSDVPATPVIAVIAALAGGLFGYGLASDHYTARLETFRAGIVQAQAEQTARALGVERENARLKSEMEAVNAAWDEERRAAALETDRLKSDLGDALRKLQRRAGAGVRPGGMPQPADAARLCADLRAANAALAGALERIVAGGGGIVADGQRADDVAGTAAEWARKIDGRR